MRKLLHLCCTELLPVKNKTFFIKVSFSEPLGKYNGYVNPEINAENCRAGVPFEDKDESSA